MTSTRAEAQHVEFVFSGPSTTSQTVDAATVSTMISRADISSDDVVEISDVSTAMEHLHPTISVYIRPHVHYADRLVLAALNQHLFIFSCFSPTQCQYRFLDVLQLNGVVVFNQTADFADETLLSQTQTVVLVHVLYHIALLKGHHVAHSCRAMFLLTKAITELNTVQHH